MDEQTIDIEKKKAKMVPVKKEEKKPSIFRRVICLIFLIILSPILLIVYIIKTIIKNKKRKKWEEEGKRGKLLLLSCDISDIDIMEGYEFENYLKTLLFYEGYNVTQTQKAKDYGADLILANEQEKIVVQAKRYTKSVGVKSVQEVLGAINHYKASSGCVITNSYFTSAAETLAKENQVRLIDRQELIEIYRRVKEKLEISTKESEIINKEDAEIEDKFPYMI